jgi:hypothetical protein
VDLLESLEQPPVAPEPATLKLADPEGTGGRAAGTKRGNQPAPTEPAEKQKKAEPTTKSPLPPKTKKVIKRQATTIAG